MTDHAEPPRARTDDPATSHAADRFIQQHVDSLRHAILKALRHNYSGLTTRQIADVTQIDWGSVSPRMITLEKLGYVVRGTIERATAKHPRKSIVWYITHAGFQYLEGSA